MEIRSIWCECGQPFHERRTYELHRINACPIHGSVCGCGYDDCEDCASGKTRGQESAEEN